MMATRSFLGLLGGLKPMPWSIAQSAKSRFTSRMASCSSYLPRAHLRSQKAGQTLAQTLGKGLCSMCLK